MQRRRFALSLALLSTFMGSPSLAENLGSSQIAASSSSGQRTIKLQGRAEVQDSRDPGLIAWQASMAYRQGAAALNANDYKTAAAFFHAAGDGFLASVGEGKPVADARFAEAQALRLAKDDVQAQKVFKIAVDLFRKYDPTNPFLKAGQGYMDHMTKPKLAATVSCPLLKGKAATTVSPAKLQAMEARLDSIDRNIPLKGKLTQFEDGTKFFGLKDGDYFGGSQKRFLSEPAAVDISDGFVRDNVYKGFLKMTCLEFAALGGNYYTAADSYKTFKSDGKTVIIGASEDGWNPVIHLQLNGKSYGVSMYLPGLGKTSKNVLLVTDGNHVLAIDPHRQDIWKLVPTITNTSADFSWWKLTHVKKKSS